MASKKSILPFILIASAGAALLMGSGTAKASGSKTSTDPNDGLPPGDSGEDLEEVPPPDNGGQQNPKDTVWKIDPEGGPLTTDEKNAIQMAMMAGGVKVDPTYYPSPYNAKKANQSMLDWKTNLAFWTAYSTSQSPWVLSGQKAAPFKIVKGTPNANMWAAKWLKIRNAIALTFPDVETNPAYAQGIYKG